MRLKHTLIDLFIHTDYMPEWLKLEEGEVFRDHRTTVSIDSIAGLEFTEEIDYNVNPEYVDFPEKAHWMPFVQLLDIKIESEVLGTFHRPVLFFFFENYNFFEEIILRKKLNISHIVKVREGTGYGGNRKSISTCYAFLSVLKTKYLIADGRTDLDVALKNEIAANHDLRLYDFAPNVLYTHHDWSGYRVKIFKVNNLNEELTDERLSEILNVFTY